MYDSEHYRSFYSCISDLLKQPDVLAMKDIAQHADVNCLQHCLYVAYLSFRMCRFFHLDYHAAARGALLHDLFLYDWHIPDKTHRLHGFTHPAKALENAKTLLSSFIYQVYPSDQYDIIFSESVKK